MSEDDDDDDDESHDVGVTFSARWFVEKPAACVLNRSSIIRQVIILFMANMMLEGLCRMRLLQSWVRTLGGVLLLLAIRSGHSRRSFFLWADG